MYSCGHAQVAVGYILCGFQHLQSFRVVSWTVERTDHSWGVTGLYNYDVNFLHVIGYNALVIE